MSLSYTISEKKLPTGSVGKLTIVSGCVTTSLRYCYTDNCPLPIMISDIEAGRLVPHMIVIQPDLSLEIEPYPKVSKHRDAGPLLIINDVYQLNLFNKGDLAVKLLRDLCESIKRLCVMDRIAYEFTSLRNFQPGWAGTTTLENGGYNIPIVHKPYHFSGSALRVLCNMMSDFNIGCASQAFWADRNPMAGYGCSMDPFEITFHGTKCYRTIDVEICQAGVGFFFRLNEYDFHRFYDFISGVLIENNEILTFKPLVRTRDNYVTSENTAATTCGNK